jgi:hypothetical protein
MYLVRYWVQRLGGALGENFVQPALGDVLGALVPGTALVEGLCTKSLAHYWVRRLVSC